MSKVTFILHHSESTVTDPVPERWNDYWVHALSREAGVVYLALCDHHLASTEIGLKLFASYLGMSQTKFQDRVLELEQRGFLWVDTDERPPVITVNDVPEVDPDAPPITKRDTPPTAWQTMWLFINHWCDLHDRRIEEPYPRPERGKGRDTVLIDEMLRTYSLETLKSVATFFFKVRGAEEPSTLAYFKWHLPRLVSEWKGQGGVSLPKMKKV